MLWALARQDIAADRTGGHVDDAELDRSRPLVSISLGCAAVFLCGGPTKAISPQAIWLRSGDVCIFAGPARTYVHGVPRILPDTCPPDLAEVHAWPAARGGSGPARGGSGAARDGSGVETSSHDAAFAAGRPPDDDALETLCAYVRGARLNINVREVGRAS